MKYSKLLIPLLAITASGIIQAEVKVVAHPSMSSANAPAAAISKIFLGKDKALEGTRVIPLDQDEGEAPRDEFYTKIANKNASQLKAYWSRLIFTGKGQPPKAVLDDDEVIELVAANPNMIGYVSGDADTSTVKVLLSVP